MISGRKNVSVLALPLIFMMVLISNVHGLEETDRLKHFQKNLEILNSEETFDKIFNYINKTLEEHGGQVDIKEAAKLLVVAYNNSKIPAQTNIPYFLENMLNSLYEFTNIEMYTRKDLETVLDTLTANDLLTIPPATRDELLRFKNYLKYNTTGVLSKIAVLVAYSEEQIEEWVKTVDRALYSDESQRKLKDVALKMLETYFVGREYSGDETLERPTYQIKAAFTRISNLLKENIPDNEKVRRLINDAMGFVVDQPKLAKNATVVKVVETFYDLMSLFNENGTVAKAQGLHFATKFEENTVNWNNTRNGIVHFKQLVQNHNKATITKAEQKSMIEKSFGNGLGDSNGAMMVSRNSFGYCFIVFGAVYIMKMFFGVE